MALLNWGFCSSSTTPSPSLQFLNNSNSNSPLISLPVHTPFRRRFTSLRLNATVAVKSPSASNTDAIATGPKKLLLEVKDLSAVISESKQPVLKGLSLTIYEGEIHAIMGKNGSGKSTFSKVLVGHRDYEVTGGTVAFKGENLLEMEAEKRSLAGLFLSFLSPVEIPGVSNIDFLQMAYNARRKEGFRV